jgi:hypothetical protein
VVSTTALSGLTSTSKVAIWRLWVYIVSFAIWVHEKIVETNAENSRPHTLRWYREQALSFLDGLELVWKDGQFQYNTEGVDDIEERQVIDRCAVSESVDGKLIIKVATEINNIVQPVADDKLLRFTSYINQIKDAGNELEIVNRPPDKLKLTLKVYVDEQIIDLIEGTLLSNDQAIKPVEVAIDNHLRHLEFNGALVKEFLRDTIQNADGVKLPVIEELQWRYAGLPYQPIDQWQVPDAGYFTIDELTISYLPYDLAAN